MSHPPHPILNPLKRSHIEGDFRREEVVLANRNSGLLLEALHHDITPAGLHYLLNHFDVPYVPGDAWTLHITGHVRRPSSVDLAAIKRLPARTIPVTLECAGSGRGDVTPRWQSMPWQHTAVGTAAWTGTPLSTVLQQAGLRDDAVEVAFYGADRGFDSGVEHNFARSLQTQVALADDVLLVWAMNGMPLLPQHGYPLRLIVPGWYGMASVKWLDRIEVLDRPFDGYQQVRTYMYRQQSGVPGIPITHMRVKSLMAPPGIPDWYTRRRLCERGGVSLSGRAWSGGGVGIARVEVAVDGDWRDARLDPSVATAEAETRFAWRGWRYHWQAEPGDHVLLCRATDLNGNTQPIDPPWDTGGFGNNAVHRIEVTVR